jgi:hypothetical protein
MFLKTREAICEHYGMGKVTFYNCLADGAPVVQIGRTFTTHTKDFDQWMRDKMKAKAAEAEAELEGMKK